MSQSMARREITKSLTKLQSTARDFRSRQQRINTEVDIHVAKKLGLPILISNSTTESKAKAKSFTNQKIPLLSSKQLLSSPKKQPSNKQLTLKLLDSKSKCIEKDYEKYLNQLQMSSDFLQALFSAKCEENNSKAKDYKFSVFLKNLYHRLYQAKQINFKNLNFGSKSLPIFANWLISSENQIAEADLSFCVDLATNETDVLLIRLLKTSSRIKHYSLNNMGLGPRQIGELFKIINREQRVTDLDIGNTNSQSVNRFGEEIEVLGELLKSNRSVSTLKLDNLQLKKQGIQAIYNSLRQNHQSPLQVLSLSGNFITHHATGQICSLIRQKLTVLDLSDNPLGQQFYVSMTPWKNCTINRLNLSGTNMTSLGLIQFLKKIEEVKYLQHLQVDRNDFSHHWFMKVKEMMESNVVLESLSMVDCRICTIVPLLEGISHHRTLKRLNLNGNSPDNSENFAKAVASLEMNQKLEELKLKFSGLKQDNLISLFKALHNNKSLRFIDVSENAMAEPGARAVLLLLTENTTIQTILVNRMQVTQKMRMEIEKKLKENKEIRDKQQLQCLKSANLQMKERDQFTWDDLERLQERVLTQDQAAAVLKDKIIRLEVRHTEKRQQCREMIRQKREEEKKIDIRLQQSLRTENERLLEIEREIQRKKREMEQIEQGKRKECALIQQLQSKIREENVKIRARENELQEHYRNEKYKKMRPKKKSVKGSFDHVASVGTQSKRGSLRHQ